MGLIINGRLIYDVGNDLGPSFGSTEVHWVPATPDSYYAQFDDPSDKTCSDCDHPAYSPWSVGPGRYAGFKCVCCIRKIWEATVINLAKSLAELPDECLQGAAPQRPRHPLDSPEATS